MGGQLSGCVRVSSRGPPGSRSVSTNRQGTCHVPDNVAQACGTVGNLFFEVEGSTAEAWEYVGEGKGGHSKLQSYSLVGSGEGTFDQEKQHALCARCVRNFFTGVCVLILLSAVGFAVLQVYGTEIGKEVKDSLGVDIDPSRILPSLMQVLKAPAGPVDATTAAPTASVVAPAAHMPSGPVVLGKQSPRFLCATGATDARMHNAVYAEWDATNADSNEQVSGSELSQRHGKLSSQTMALLLDADADGDGSLAFQEFAAALGRSAEIGAKSEDVGVAGGSSQQTDVQGEVHNDVATWSLDERAWCCSHWAVGCDGLAEERTRLQAEAQAKKLAEEKAKAKAEQAETPMGQVASKSESDPYDCEAGIASWSTGWTLGKKDWCCRNRALGCGGEGSVDLTGASAQLSASSAPVAKKEGHHQVSTEGHQAEKEATEIKKQVDKEQSVQIMQHEAKDSGAKAQEATAAVTYSDQRLEISGLMLYDCNAGLDKTWSDPKRDWCCTNLKKGCLENVVVPVASSTPMQLAAPQAPPPPLPVSLDSVNDTQFNCDEGVTSWEWGWSDSKKKFCCTSTGKGCPKVAKVSGP